MLAAFLLMLASSSWEDSERRNGTKDTTMLSWSTADLTCQRGNGGGGGRIVSGGHIITSKVLHTPNWPTAAAFVYSKLYPLPPLTSSSVSSMEETE